MKIRKKIFIGIVIGIMIIGGGHLALDQYISKKIFSPMINAIGAKENTKHITDAIEKELKKIEIPKEFLFPPAIIERFLQRSVPPKLDKDKERHMELLRKLDVDYILELEKDGISDEEVESIKAHMKERLSLVEFEELKDLVQRYMR